MVEQALELGLSWLGFSAHAPLPFSTGWNMEAGKVQAYLDELGGLASEFRGRLGILIGMEADWIDGPAGPALSGQAWAPSLDYRIGSVHFVNAPDGYAMTVDSPEEEFLRDMATHSPGGARPLVEAYYAGLAAMARRGGFDIIGHFDLPRKNNQGDRLFSEGQAWYRDAAMEALEAAAASGAVLEVNTGGMARGRTDTPYPSAWLLREFRARGVPALVSSDAHSPGLLMAHADEALAALRAAGYREAVYLTDKGWRGYLLE
jgi:histidinol-phosphatase (PHP family)